MLFVASMPSAHYAQWHRGCFSTFSKTSRGADRGSPLDVVRSKPCIRTQAVVTLDAGLPWVGIVDPRPSPWISNPPFSRTV